MKNNFSLYIIIFICFLITMPAHAAKSVKVQAVTEFNSLRPVSTMKVIVLEKSEFKNGLVFEDGTLLYGNIIDVKQPKRAKLNASFRFKPVTYTYLGKTKKIEDPEFIAKYAECKELDKLGIATSAATTAGGMIFHIPLLSEGVSLVKGIWKNPENNRLKSGVVQVYKDSPLSYIEEGKDIDIKADTVFILKFKASDAEDLEEEQQEGDNIQNSTPNTVPTANQPPKEKTENPPVTSSAINIVHPEDVLKEVELNTTQK